MPGNDESPSSSSDDAIPVTVLSGFLGSGKTTLLKHILESCEHGLRVAVIVNDMAELNIDGQHIRQQHHEHHSGEERKGGKTFLADPPLPPSRVPGGSTPGQKHQVVQAQRELITLQNGCICCTLRGDLIREIARIKNESTEKFDYVLIESTGIAEPKQVAQAFCFDPSTAQLASSEDEMLWKQARLDSCVTVVDAHTFLCHSKTLEQFVDKFKDGLDDSTEEGKAEGTKPIANLLLEQVEFANVILVNKTDLVTDEERKKVMSLVRALNPGAKLIPTQYSRLHDLGLILNTHLFDMKKVSNQVGWWKSIKGANEIESEIDEYGIGSFVFRARTPFHPKRIALWLNGIIHQEQNYGKLSQEDRLEMESDQRYKNMVQNYGCIMRAKGFCWLAGYDSISFGYAQSGRIGSIEPIMNWYCLIPKEKWGTDQKGREFIEGLHQEPHGDRRQELVFIGTDLKTESLKNSLNKCLMTKDELDRYEFYSDTGGAALQKGTTGQ